MNQTEASLIVLIATSLIRCGMNASEIGIISPYRAQCRLISEGTKEFEELEVSTVDRFQGRDKDAVLISFCCSNTGKKVGKLLRDWRRVNVAITRAKRKLLMIGSLSTLTTDALFRSLFDLLTGKGWVCTLPPAALSMYKGENDLKLLTEKIKEK